MLTILPSLGIPIFVRIWNEASEELAFHVIKGVDFLSGQIGSEIRFLARRLPPRLFNYGNNQFRFCIQLKSRLSS